VHHYCYFLLLLFVFFRIDMREMLSTVSKVLDGHPKLIDNFNKLLPPGMPLSNFSQSDAKVTVVFVC